MFLKLLRYLFYVPFLYSLFFSSYVFSQKLTGDQIKAAYIFNFLKHVTWPDEKQKTVFRVAIYQDKKAFELFAKALNNQKVKNKYIDVQFVNTTEQAAKAELVFVSKNTNIDISTVATYLRKTGTLLVTDNSIDKHNIMINLVFNQDTSAFSFEVNKSNIIFEQLKMSAELLLLGGSEIDIAELYRATELAMQKMRQRETQLQKALDTQAAQMKIVDFRLSRLNEDLLAREKISEQRQVELLSLKKNIDIQKRSIASKEQQLEELISQLSDAKIDLENNHSLAEKNTLENQKMSNRIVKNKAILEQQQLQIDQQGLLLNRKNEELAERKKRIDQQHFYLMILIIIILITAAISILVVWLFIKNKKTNQQLSQTLTNLKSIQDQLIQSEKLASLGQLTAGIAHEINTPLGIAVTSTSSALESTKTIQTAFKKQALTKTEFSRFINTIEQASTLNMSSLNRVIELLDNFKQVAADQVIGEVRDIDVAEYINEVIQALSAEIKRHRVNYTYLGECDIHMNTIPGALAQIITNLVTNSIKHGFSQRISGNVNLEVREKANKVIITYTDDGEGMDNEVLQNIFEPFFTTKRHNGGTGLGMNIVHNIVTQKLKGDIQVLSKPLKGARFIMTFPKFLNC